MKQAARIHSTNPETPPLPAGAIEDAPPLTASPSPARELQRRLQMSLPDMPHADGSVAGAWPPYARTGFILLSAASLWAAIIASLNISFG